MELPKPFVRGVAAVLLFFGFALAALLILILVRHSARPTELGVVVAGATALTAFCLLLGYRLLFNRPNRRGSLLSPLGWRLLATCFGVVALFVGATMIQNPDTAAVVATIAAAALAYACVMAARGQQIELPPPRVFPPETSLLELGGFAPARFRQGVEILNDERTTMEFVVSVLQKHFGLDEPEAIRTMLEIHRRGEVILARASLEESIRSADAVTEESRLGNHPLTCRAVSVEGGVNGADVS